MKTTNGEPGGGTQPWDDVLTPRDVNVFGASGYGGRVGIGQRPVLLVVDMTYSFVGDKPEPILESIKRWPNSCGEEGWAGVEHIRRLIETARETGVPVVFTKGVPDGPNAPSPGRWADKSARHDEWGVDPRAHEIVDELKPRDGEFVIAKRPPSAFFGTPLASYLTDVEADSVIVCGTTTSGCVRATVVDAFSMDYRVTVPIEGTFDRGEASHKIGLFDMHQKYADVLPCDEVIDALRATDGS